MLRLGRAEKRCILVRALCRVSFEKSWCSLHSRGLRVAEKPEKCDSLAEGRRRSWSSAEGAPHQKVARARSDASEATTRSQRNGAAEDSGEKNGRKHQPNRSSTDERWTGEGALHTGAHHKQQTTQ